MSISQPIEFRDWEIGFYVRHKPDEDYGGMEGLIVGKHSEGRKAYLVVKFDSETRTVEAKRVWRIAPPASENVEDLENATEPVAPLGSDDEELFTEQEIDDMSVGLHQSVDSIDSETQ